MFEFEQNTMRTIVAGTPYATNFGWNQVHGGTNSADGNWHCFEVHVKSETASGAGNGISQWWSDGDLRHDVRNVTFGNSSSGFNGFALPENGNFATVNGADMYNDIDDVVVSTTGPIGCI